MTAVPIARRGRKGLPNLPSRRRPAAAACGSGACGMSPDCRGSGQLWECDDPVWRRRNWCGACWGSGVVEMEQ